MNLTISSLILTSLLAPSPAFINNRYLIIDCNFQKFTSTLFRNQKNLNIKGTSFIYGLSSVIINDNEIITENNHITITNETNSISKDEQTGNYSITVIECFFAHIESTPSIQINSQYISMYITKSSFSECCGLDKGIIQLGRSRCLTLTHICAYDCKAKGQHGFLYYDCVPNDFSVCLYNTIAKTQNKDDDYRSANNIFCKSGSQYWRCNNITDLICNAYQFDAPQCLSFGMNTVVDCQQRAFSITGYEKNQNTQICGQIFSKTISNVNLIVNGDQSILYFHSQCSFGIKIENSVLLYQNSSLVKIGDDSSITITIKDCILNTQLNRDNLILEGNNEYVDYDKTHIVLYPHYTYDKCEGPVNNNDDENKAVGCNAGNCIDKECGNTIGFPTDVVPYTTILFTDINTPTPSQTDMFTKTFEFSNSGSFSKSKEFSNSGSFSESKGFSNSGSFSESKGFSNSGSFSESKGFSNSGSFSESKEFSNTGSFSESKVFSNSCSFSKSFEFTLSSKFPATKGFSKTDVFSMTTGFTKTNDFSYSKVFSQSMNFTESLDFDHTHSFTPSSYFSPSNYFSSSNAFSSSFYFTSSAKFSPSKSFSPSIHFSESNCFSQSFQFSQTSEFQDANLIVLTEKPKSNAALIGGVVGAIAAVLIIAGLVFFFVKKRKKIVTSDINMLETQESVLTIDNDLQDMMDNDDPFAADFVNNNK